MARSAEILTCVVNTHSQEVTVVPVLWLDGGPRQRQGGPSRSRNGKVVTGRQPRGGGGGGEKPSEIKLRQAHGQGIPLPTQSGRSGGI